MFVFLGSGITVPNWDFQGSTIITDKYVRLTPDLQSKSGAIWNSIVCAKFFFFFFIKVL